MCVQALKKFFPPIEKPPLIKHFIGGVLQSVGYFNDFDFCVLLQ